MTSCHTHSPAKTSCGLALMTLLLAAPAVVVTGQDAQHHQGGFAFNVTYDDSRVLVETDGSVTSVDLAVALATHGVSSALSPVGSSGLLFEAAVSSVDATTLAGIAATPGVTAAMRVVRFRADGHPFGVSQRISVKFDQALSEAQVADFEQAYDLKYLPELTGEIGIRGVYIFEVLGQDVLDRVTALQADPDLVDWKASADLIGLVETRQAVDVINDPLFGDQWHLENSGQSGGKIDADIDALDAWDSGPGTGLGSGVLIGMHDNGCEISHPDLQGNFSGFSLNVITGGQVPDGNHGTSVMGLMAAPNNSIGVRGVAPEAKFAPSGPLAGSSILAAKAFAFALEQGVEVHNNSWGLVAGVIPDILGDAIVEAANQGRGGKGMVIIWASGNGGRELDQGDDLSTLPEVVQAGATGQSDTIASYSNYGITQDVMGPSLGDDGVGVVTTDLIGSRGYNSGSDPTDLLGQPDFTDGFGGTSAACPVVAGVAALVVAANDELDRIQVREILTHTADQVSPLDAEYNPTTGFSLRYAYGRVNAGAAVRAAEASKSNLNRTWPGVPQIANAFVFEGPESLQFAVDWRPVGMPPADEDDPIEDTDEAGVLVAYLLNTTTSNRITWRPNDGTTYDAGELDDPVDGERPDPDDENLVILYSGPPLAVTDPIGGSSSQPVRRLFGLAIEGEDDDDQVFAMYAFNDDGLYSYGVVFDEEGNVQLPTTGPGGGVNPIPPDSGTPINPDIIVEDPGLNDPPSVSATASVTVGVAPLSVQFHGNAVTPNEIEDRGWSFGDGASSDDNSIMHTYQQPGIFSAVYFAQDEFDEVSTRMLRIQVMEDAEQDDGIPSVPATATIEQLTEGLPQAPDARVRFRVNTTGIGEGEGVAVSYAWTFGDGQTGTGQTTENIYESSGFYVVVVEVTEVRPDGQVLQISASEIVEIGGSSSNNSSGQTTPPPQANGGSDGSQDQSQACGVVGPGMVLFMFLGLCGVRRARRRTL